MLRPQLCAKYVGGLERGEGGWGTVIGMGMALRLLYGAQSCRLRAEGASLGPWGPMTTAAAFTMDGCSGLHNSSVPWSVLPPPPTPCTSRSRRMQADTGTQALHVCTGGQMAKELCNCVEVAAPMGPLPLQGLTVPAPLPPAPAVLRQ